jgi:hypothetical protein
MEPDDLARQLDALCMAFKAMPGYRGTHARLVLTTLYLCLFDPTTPAEDLDSLAALVSVLADHQIETRKQRAAPNN